MKTRFTLDFKIFSLILKELRAIKRELKNVKGTPAATPAPKREIKDKIYSQDVLKRLRISPATLIKYEKRGLIKFHKEGRSKVYSEAEILAFRKLKRGRKRLGKNFSPEQ
ncbi:MAG TPA: MerR family transcriptional regulator [Bacteroidia bacterium]|nr:MerR family transcriptional regulator [Bacteroidia bacterium]